MLQANPTGNFSKQTQTKSLLERWQFIVYQSNWVVFFTSKQLNKGVETQDKEGIQLFLWIGFLVPCETHGMNIHYSIQSRDMSCYAWFVWFMVKIWCKIIFVHMAGTQRGIIYCIWSPVPLHDLDLLSQCITHKPDTRIFSNLERKDCHGKTGQNAIHRHEYSHESYKQWNNTWILYTWTSQNVGKESYEKFSVMCGNAIELIWLLSCRLRVWQISTTVDCFSKRFCFIVGIEL